MATEIKVPTLGESITEATVAKWYKNVGDKVAVDELICDLETDKLSVEVMATAEGVITEIVAPEGSNVEVDGLLAHIDANGAAASSEAPAASASAEIPEKPATSAETAVVKVPTLGESITEATVSKWYKSVGDSVAMDELICDLETDKLSVEVTATAAGVLTEILAAEGSNVEVDADLAKIDANGAAAAPSKPAAGAAEAADAPAPAAPSPAPAPAVATEQETNGVAMMPSAAKLVAQHKLDAAVIPATGTGGSLTKGDVLKFLETGEEKAAPAPVAPAPQAQVAPEVVASPREEAVPMSRLRRRVAERLKEAQNTAAMLTTYNEVDMSAVMELRSEYRDVFEKKHGVRMGFMSFFVKACVQALKEVPEVNAEIRGDDIVYKNYFDIGVAASTPSGLVVPVVRNCDTLGFAEVEQEIGRLGKKARDGKLTMDEMTGGSFTISNGGIFGSLMSSPILNAPQSGILGMHAIKKRAVVIDDQIVIRPMMYLALSYDHRIVDGKGAVTFLVRVKENLEDPQRLLLDL
ncbi:MAG: dihydrolipoyllysine-residue succinyltransferase [Kordiimonas sp.]|nr:dihydrolipoyllysine-residue succinyltransferase [Kordiimonas sp.]